ncbi:MAG: hypothetical protein JJ896_10080 [Rhodothermales bacterium]|nr:hypothetical protein [Rhodothermales bacterium]MBO6779988.1 hypothetical protein [Rhodothermales bacterium]
MTRLLPALALLLLVACDSGSDEPDSISAQTILTSSTLAPQVAAPKTAGIDFEITPSNVTGDALSVLFTIDPAPDDGIVVFGDGRPDIAPSSAQLFPFDFAQEVPINASIQIKPTLADGTSNRAVVLLGYTDFDYIQLDGTERTVRIALADVNGMTRGDKLLAIGSGFQWFDLDTQSFTSTRPANPVVIPEIRDFSDPIRPNLVFYPLIANLTTPIPITASDFLSASTIDAQLDFTMSGALTLVGHSTSDLTSEELIQAITLTQILGGATAEADGELNPN